MASGQQLLIGTIGLGLLVLFIAFGFPALIGATDGMVTVTLELSGGESVDIGQALGVTANDVAQNEATFTLTSLQTGASATQTIQEGTTATYSLDGQSVDVELVTTSGNYNAATVVVGYPSRFGFSDAGIGLLQRVDVMLVLIAFIIIAGFLIIVVND